MKYLSIDDGATLDIQLNNMFIVIQSCCYLLWDMTQALNYNFINETYSDELY